MKLARLAAALVALGLIIGLTTGAGGLAPTYADTAPVLHLNPFDKPVDPHIVPTSGSETYNVEVSASTDVTNLVLTASGDGLTLPDGDTQTYPSLRKGRFRFDDFSVTADSPGFHSMTLTLTADGAKPVTKTLGLLWSPGGPAITGGGDLSGRSWEYEACYRYSESDACYTDSLTFVTPTYAAVGDPVHEVPTCSATTCERYHYDRSTGLVQIGKGLIGRVVGPHLFIEGLTPGDADLDEHDGSTTLTERLVEPRADARLSGAWTYDTALYPVGLESEHLVLHRDGTYRLAYEFTDEAAHHLAGRYRILPRGRIRLQQAHRPATTLTFLVRADRTGHAHPGRLGVRLVVTEPKTNSHASHAEGGSLAPDQHQPTH